MFQKNLQLGSRGTPNFTINNPWQTYRIGTVRTVKQEGLRRVHVWVDAGPNCVRNGSDEVGRDCVAEEMREEDLRRARKAATRRDDDVKRHVAHNRPVAVQKKTWKGKQEL